MSDSMWDLVGGPGQTGLLLARGRLEDEQREQRRALRQPRGVDALVPRMRALTDGAEAVERTGVETRGVGVRAAADDACVLERHTQLMPQPLCGCEEGAVAWKWLHRRPAEPSFDLDRRSFENRLQ